MRVAIVSDLHANLQAVQAVAKDIEEQQVQETWCLGDVVGYGAQPREVLQWTEKHARLLVKGNHDHAVASGDLAWFNDNASAAARFHAQLLDPDERARIFAWPTQTRRTIDGTDVLLVHASPDDPLREYVLPDDAQRGLARWQGQAHVILMGHTHVPYVASLDAARGASSKAAPEPAWHHVGFAQAATGLAESPHAAPLLLVNPGSVGQPRDLDPRASYAILDFERRAVELRRVAYDVESAAQAIQRAGLPAMLGLRLYRGR